MSLHRSEFFSVQYYRVYPKTLKEMLEALGLSEVVNKRKPTEACRNGNRSSKPHYSLEALMSPNTTKASTAKNFL